MTPFETNKATIFAALRQLGITELTATFNGGGDEGQIEDITPELPKTTSVVYLEISRSYVPQDVDLPEAVDRFCYEVIAEEFAGWENNDGGYGEVQFDIEAGTVTLDMNLYYLESTSHARVY